MKTAWLVGLGAGVVCVASCTVDRKSGHQAASGGSNSGGAAGGSALRGGSASRGGTAGNTANGGMNNGGSSPEGDAGSGGEPIADVAGGKNSGSGGLGGSFEAGAPNGGSGAAGSGSSTSGGALGSGGAANGGTTSGMGGAASGGTANGGNGSGGAISCSGVDLTTSAVHCGRCGHSCQGGVCEAGKCKAAAFAFNGVRFPTALAIDSTFLYWVENQDAAEDPTKGSVRKAPLNGTTTITTLASAQCKPSKIAVTSGGVFWLNRPAAGCSGGVQWLANNALDPKTLTTSASSSPQALALSADHVYWFESNPNASSETLYSLPLSNLSATPSMVSAAAACAITSATNATSLFWLQTGCGVSQGTLMSTKLSPLAAGTRMLPSGIGLNNSSPGHIAFDSTSIYFGVLDTANSQYIASVPIGGGPLTQIVPGGWASAVAVDETNLYWTDDDLLTLSTMPLNGSSPRALVSALNYPVDLVTNATTIYYAEYGSKSNYGGISKIAKP